jgi:hypothetical protein
VGDKKKPTQARSRRLVDVATGVAIGLVIGLVMLLVARSGGEGERLPVSAEGAATPAAEADLPFEPPADLPPLPRGGELDQEDRLGLKYRLELANHTFSVGGGEFDHKLDDFDRVVGRKIDMEHVLKGVYGREITRADLEAEWRRIQEGTKAPDILRARVRALGGRQDLVLEGICRPLLVERFIREEFRKDESVQREAREEAERIRSGLTRENFKSRAGERYRRREFAAPGSPPGRGPERAFPLSGKMEEEVERLSAGEISPVFETETAFMIAMLVDRNEGRRVVDMAVVPKVAFDEWFAGARKR